MSVHATTNWCPECDKAYTHECGVEKIEFTVDSLAAALHAWRKTQTLAGCGWKFATVIEGKAYCPCPADAMSILKAAKEASE